MIVLVCGGRDYAGDVSCLGMIDITLLIHGGARGADQRAAAWVREELLVHTCRVDAMWEQLGKSAGMERNKAMLLLKPEYVVAFPGGAGTAGMIRLAKAAGLPVWQPYG